MTVPADLEPVLCDLSLAVLHRCGVSKKRQRAYFASFDFNHPLALREIALHFGQPVRPFLDAIAAEMQHRTRRPCRVQMEAPH